MSIPRSLHLRRVKGRLRLIQTPVVELESLRTNHVHLENLPIAVGEASLAGQTVSGDRLEIQVEFEVGDAKEFGLLVRKGNGQFTQIGFDVRKKELFVDRSRAGESSFHEKFAGRHAGPLQLKDGRVRLHLFVDTSSVEVFGGDGEIVITDCIFPDPTSQEVAVYSVGAPTQVKTLDVWSLQSAW